MAGALAGAEAEVSEEAGALDGLFAAGQAVALDGAEDMEGGPVPLWLHHGFEGS